MYKTEGIILKKQGAGENDAIFTIYTKDFGKIRARAQGVKKETAKLKGHLEPLNLSSLSFVSGRNGERLTQAILVNGWPNLRNDFTKIGLAHHLAEAIDKYCLVGEKDEPLWRLLKDSFLTLEDADFAQTETGNFLHKFEINLLACLGYEGEKDIRVLGF